MAVVTVSRQYGAGGQEVAPGVAQALGFGFISREIVEEAARRLGLDPDAASARDERTPDLVEEVGLALAASTPGFGPGFGMPPVADLDDRALAEASRRVIESLAETGGYVIMGRGSQCALEGRPDVLHLSLVGALADRARRVARSQQLPVPEAEQRCNQVDRERAAYLKRYYGRDIRDPLLYDVVLNTSLLSLEDATRVATVAASRKFAH